MLHAVGRRCGNVIGLPVIIFGLKEEVLELQHLKVLKVLLDLQVHREHKVIKVQREHLVEHLLNTHLAQIQQIVILVQEY